MHNNKSLIIPRKGIQHNNAHPLSQGLIGAWPLNEQGGLTAYTLKGSTNLTLSGTASVNSWGGSPLGAGLLLNGTDNYLYGPTTFANFTSENFSLTAWIKVYSFGAASNFKIFRNGVYDVAGYELSIDSTGYLFTYSSQSVANQLNGGFVSPFLNAWIFVAAVRKGTSFDVYANGINVTQDRLAITNPVSPAAYNFVIGSKIDGTATYLNGHIAFPRVYNRALTASEINTLYVSPNIDFLPVRDAINYYTMAYGLGAWKGKLINAGASGTLTATSASSVIEAGIAISFYKSQLLIDSDNFYLLDSDSGRLIVP